MKKRQVIAVDDGDSESNSDNECRKVTHTTRNPRRGLNQEPAFTADNILQKARSMLRETMSRFPKYNQVLNQILPKLEASNRMQSSAAKTVFDTATARPNCIRLSVRACEAISSHPKVLVILAL
jgi:hypothetical protein